MKGRLTAFRVGKPDIYPLWSGEGSKRKSGRWHSRIVTAGSNGIVYAGLSYGTSLLENLVHTSFRRIPESLRYLEITIPATVSRETLDVRVQHGWNRPNSAVARKVGDAWRNSMRSAILFVPSVPAPLDWNIVINLDHPDSEKLVIGPELPVVTDPRLRPKSP